MMVSAIIDTKRGRTGIVPTYLQTTRLESKQAHRVIHYPVSVVLHCSLVPKLMHGRQ